MYKSLLLLVLLQASLTVASYTTVQRTLLSFVLFRELEDNGFAMMHSEHINKDGKQCRTYVIDADTREKIKKPYIDINEKHEYAAVFVESKNQVMFMTADLTDDYKFLAHVVAKKMPFSTTAGIEIVVEDIDLAHIGCGFCTNESDSMWAFKQELK